MRNRSPLVLAALLILAPAAATAQVYRLPNAVPVVTAENTEWYQFGEPIAYADSFYYPAGPTRFFDANVMTRVGSFRGVPIYADTTLEPYSVVLVPLAGALMQPYERERANGLAGTTGSRPPSFPVDTPRAAIGGLGSAPSGLPIYPPYVTGPTQTPLVRGPVTTTATAAPAAPSASGRIGATSSGGSSRAVATERARGTSGSRKAIPKRLEVWVNYDGRRWKPAGQPTEVDPGAYFVAGNYRGFPVMKKHGADDLIYLPAVGGKIAPYRRLP